MRKRTLSFGEINPPFLHGLVHLNNLVHTIDLIPYSRLVDHLSELYAFLIFWSSWEHILLDKYVLWYSIVALTYIK